ncbi:MAG: hypothetical protein WAW61_00190 [Methylococcaceae bacterium]
MLATVSAGTAGTITNETWSPSACGTEPVVPVIEQGSVDAYNKSVKAINEWQQKANAYSTCLINEANADNALIAKIANEEQSRLRMAIEKIKTDMDAAKLKLDRQ